MAALSFLLLTAFGHIASGAVLTAETSSALMRRDAHKVDGSFNSVQLGESGQIIELHEQEAVSPEQLIKGNGQDKYVQMCNWAYIEGTASSDDCATGHNHILESEMCIEAARKMKMPTLGEFEGYFTDRLDFYKHPRGCYKGPCSKAGGECYFFNAVPLFPKKPIVGTPVCRKKLLVNGTVNTNGECPSTYKMISDEKFCSEAADCLGLCAGAEFRIGEKNRTLHDFSPKGCFIHPLEGCVYINPEYPGISAPSSPEGMPLCTSTEGR